MARWTGMTRRGGARRGSAVARRSRRVELDFGRLGKRALVLDRKLWLLLVPERHRGEIARERAHRDVVLLYRLDITIARNGDAILRAFELSLQVAKIRVGFKLRIILDDNQEAR